MTALLACDFEMRRPPCIQIVLLFVVTSRVALTGIIRDFVLDLSSADVRLGFVCQLSLVVVGWDRSLGISEGTLVLNLDF